VAELIQAGDEILLSVIHKLINFIWNKEELLDQLKEPITVPIHKNCDKTDCNNYHEIPPRCQLHTKFYHKSLSQG
jgi:hypothetical protein